MTGDKKIERRELVRKVKKISHGLFGTMTDLVLFELIYLIEAAGSTSKKQAWGVSRRAQRRLYDFNYATVKNILYRLKRKGFINSFKLAMRGSIINQVGRDRLKNTIPTYLKKRPWDRRIYLISYDIDEQFRRDRDKLRILLTDLRCGLLQKSIWLSIYNPTKFINEYIKKNHLHGQILVSDLGEDGAIGDESLNTLVYRVFKLGEINQQYIEFCLNYKENKSKLKDKIKKALIYHYLSILKEDPQLPFALLPNDWQGDKAYLYYKYLFNKFIRPK